VVPRVRALRLGGAAPGHRAPGDRAQRKRRGYYRADETSDPVFHWDECCREITEWQGWRGSGAAEQRGSGAAEQRSSGTKRC
jgi:hypothetical protein